MRAEGVLGRRIFEEQPEYPYHVTGRCINREWFSLPMDQVWEIFQEQLFFLHHAFCFEVHSFVLMKNHYHMLVRTPKCNLSEGMRWFMKETTRYINQGTGRINQVWGGRYFRSRIESDFHYKNVYKYVYCNPIRAGLADKVLDYKYSTLRGLLGFENLTAVIIDNALFGSHIGKTIKWLDDQPSDECWEAIRKGLRKNIFSLPEVKHRPRRKIAVQPVVSLI